MIPIDRRACLWVCAFAIACGSPSAERTEGASLTPAPSAATSPGASAGIDLRVLPPRIGCEVALVRTGATFRVTTGAPAAGELVVCLEGRDVPAMAELVDERIDVLEEGRGPCERAERFTFRHDGVVVRTRCEAPHQVSVEVEGPRGSTRVADLELGDDAAVRVAWAGDWDHDGHAECVIVARRGAEPASEPAWIGVVGLEPDDRVVTLASWAP